jgi:hypothetical protein
LIAALGAALVLAGCADGGSTGPALKMSAGQIGAFRELFGEGNSREVQPLNGRTIVTDAEVAALAGD